MPYFPFKDHIKQKKYKMINNNPQNFEGDINYLIIEYLKNQKFKSNSEKEEIITKVYFLFFKFLNFSL